MPSEKKAWDYLKEGIAYVCNPANTLREFRSLPRAAKGVFAFLIAGLVTYFVMVADYSFWGWLAIAGLVFSAINLVLVDNGKLTSYPWGILCSLCTIIGAVKYQMYADMVYYVFVFPYMIYGLMCWQRLADKNTSDNPAGAEATRALSVPRRDIWKYALLLVGSYIVMYFLSVVAGGAIPLVDSLILSCGVVGQIFLSKSYKQQWIMWLAQDIIAVIAWSIRYSMALSAGEPATYTLSMVLMWGIFLVNAIYGCWQWYHMAANEHDIERGGEYAAELGTESCDHAERPLRIPESDGIGDTVGTR